MNTDSQEIWLSRDELGTLHWLATNGFRRLLLLGEKGSLGFQSEEQAERAHWALDHLEHIFRKMRSRRPLSTGLARSCRGGPKANFHSLMVRTKMDDRLRDFGYESGGQVFGGRMLKTAQ